jgi:hypothetical protein
MPEPYLHLGHVGLMGERIGGSGGPQRVRAEAGEFLGEAALATVTPHDVPIREYRVQGLGRDLAVVILDGSI